MIQTIESKLSWYLLEKKLDGRQMENRLNLLLASLLFAIR
jgi:hypothetical protein